MPSTRSCPVKSLENDYDDNAKKRIRELNDQLESEKKRAKTAERKSTDLASSIAQEFICPISHELMIDPVTAEDGHLYEREEIERTIEVQGANLLSPKTGERMGEKLLPASSARSTIAHLVTSCAVDGELAEQYHQRKLVIETKRKAKDGDIDAMECLAQWYENGANGIPENKEKANEWKLVVETKRKAKDGDADAMSRLAEWYENGLKGLLENVEKAKEWRKKAKDANHLRKLKEKAEGGDGNAMFDLGVTYENGCYGLTKDVTMAFFWFEKSAKKRCTEGMAAAGEYIACGYGGAIRSVAQGSYLTGRAAEKGSDLACYYLGEWHLKGLNGFPKDRDEAEHWLQSKSQMSSRLVFSREFLSAKAQVST